MAQDEKIYAFLFDLGVQPNEFILKLSPQQKEALRKLCAHSPYLLRLLQKHQVHFFKGLEKNVASYCQDLFARLESPLPSLNKSAFQAFLRNIKGEIALRLGFEELCTPESVLIYADLWSTFADKAVQVALNWALTEQHKQGKIALSTDSPFGGYFVLALGKLGGESLNYSSDIDLICLFDAETAESCTTTPFQFFPRLTRDLISLLQERTADGFVFRVDLRLRPNPSSTSLALSCEQAERYYESLGQTWERSALIKARCIAGDQEASQRFLSNIHPFIWRKYLDYYALEEIVEMKDKVHQHHGQSSFSLLGYNLKLGLGGIREIEFYISIQQLIWGGRIPVLQKHNSIEALDELQKKNLIDQEAAHDLAQSYTFLRHLEHLLQMEEDRQTHSFPTTLEGLEAFALFAGYPSVSELEKALNEKRQKVCLHFNALLPSEENSPAASKEALSSFLPQEEAVQILNRWEKGEYKALQASQARQRFSRLRPTLLKAFAQTRSPIETLKAFDFFLSQLPSGMQLSYLLEANPLLITLLAKILGGSKRLSTYLSLHPHQMDALISPSFYEVLDEKAPLTENLQSFLSLASDKTEDDLNRLRHWIHDKEFQLGVQTLEETISPIQLQDSLSTLAQIAIETVYMLTLRDFKEAHGSFEESHLIIVALGRLGSHQLLFGSDLDLLFLYPTPKAELSDGATPLYAQTYYSRLAQRMISALSLTTQEGKLYEVDTRLRPHGSAGPLAQPLEAFFEYHEKEAWNWEHLALTRATVVSPVIKETPEQKENEIFEQKRLAILSRPRSLAQLAYDLLEMRKRLKVESAKDLKQRQGGLRDLEFFLQCLTLSFLQKYPEEQSFLDSSFEERLNFFVQKGFLATEDANDLTEVFLRYENHLSQSRLLETPQTETLFKSDAKKVFFLMEKYLFSLCQKGIHFAKEGPVWGRKEKTNS